MCGIEMHFSVNARGIVWLLEVATPGRRSVLATVQRLLFGLRVQIVQVESVAREHGLAERFHVVEFDGAPNRAATHSGHPRRRAKRDPYQRSRCVTDRLRGLSSSSAAR